MGGARRPQDIPSLHLTPLASPVLSGIWGEGKRNISIGGVLVPLELKCKEPDGERVVYTGIYDTEGVAPTKSGERQPIQITMPFTDIGTFETVWQVKFYNYHKRDHCQWGSPFSVIEYECKPNETRSLMWVNKESFL
ncbi:CB1 cannabinoid receptor-interacting protein 1 isoform X2 [Peromyscus leucopus]|uniref:CB1 cannabinoid receptor-interacting protein 1 isoform X2 n=1 Tax=Peromyscus leucopus TaxID=10041 RepID=UPI0018850C45|nr:CB1 cannabinoid receptor-interacting protein 1 isoform X2 [Peromyscus leucopus]